MPTRNVSLTDHQDKFVGAIVDGGRYQNASEVVREALRLLERREQADAAILAGWRADVAEGIDAIATGDFEDIELADLPAWLAALGNSPTR